MKNQVINAGIKNTAYVIAAQSISLLLSIARTLILPILLGITNFGYWQIYLLYMSYVGIFAFGFNDGIYLKYGKYDYEDLPKDIFRSSIRIFILFQIIIMLFVSTFIIFEPDFNKQISMFWALINIPIAGLTGVLIYIFQITNQLKKYSFYTILDKFVVLIFIVCLFILEIDDYIVIIIGDTFARILVLFLMINSCKDIIFGRGCGLQSAYKEIIDNIRVGIKLMLANFAGMLVLGFGRFLIERTSSVEDYGTYSFAISTMNLVLVLITAIGSVIYPTLNRLKKENYPNYFVNLNQVIIIIIFGLLIMFFPLKVFISIFMEEYIGIFKYLSVIFAIIFVQSKMQILINPYYKLLRKESMMLRANLVGFMIAVLLITPLYYITESVSMVAVGTLLAMLIRLYLSEMFLKKEQLIIDNSNIVSELLVLILFIYFGQVDSFFYGLIGYSFVYFVFIFKSATKLKLFINYVRKG